MGLGIKTRLKKLTSGPYVNDDYFEARAVSSLLREPAAPLVQIGQPLLHHPLTVGVVVPFFKPGSGGHMTIANLIRALEARGHTISLWIDDPGRRCDGDPVANLRAWFGPFAASVHLDLDAWEPVDVAVATGWQTVARVRTLPGCGAKAYLVQDHEPEFFGTSAQRIWAQDSYRHGLYPITAGQWLADTMRREYGLDASSFDLGIELDRYRPAQGVTRREDVVVFYARASTPRRAVPIALAALGELVARRPQTEVWAFGHGVPPGVDFPVKQLGVVGPADLPAIYSEATAGLVLSLTNYSLVAQEMLACGLPCVEADTPSVVAAFGHDGPVELSPVEPGAIADHLQRLLDDPQLRARRAADGAAFAQTRTWAHAGEQVEAGLREALARRAGGPAA